MMNLHSKKAFTLVELIVAVALTAVIIIAACSVLYLGANTFKSGTTNAFNQQKATLVETYLQRYAATASAVNVETDAKGEGTVFAFQEDGTLKISKQTVSNSKTTAESIESIDGIDRIELSIVNDSLNYTIVSDDSTYKLVGGIVMNNYKSGTVEKITRTNGKVLLLGRT